MISQMQRAAYSIPSNISEGCGRKSDRDFNRFLQFSIGSAHEIEYFIILARDLYYVDEATYQDIDTKVNELKKRMYALSEKLTGGTKL